jgi:hypothetical protein
MIELIGHQPDDINAAVKSTLLPSKNASKSAHVKALEQLLEEQRKTSNTEHTLATPRRKAMLSLPPAPPRVSAEDAAREKLLSGENLGVEHIAELSREQAMRALSSVVTPSLAMKKREGQKSDSIVTPSPATKKRGSRINDGDDVDNTIGDDRKERVERRRRLKYDE